MARDDVERVWGSAEYAPTAERLDPVAGRLVRRLTAALGGAAGLAEATVVDLGAGHGAVAARLAVHARRVLAIEPTARMREAGRRSTDPAVTWLDALGEDTGLRPASVDAVASNFGALFCDPGAGPAEWCRILKPGGVLAMTVWDERGFLAEMTRRMLTVLPPGGPQHLLWGRDEVIHQRLATGFAEIAVEHLDLPWHFDSIADGMRLYQQGSPTHSFTLAALGERRELLAEALEGHLRDEADPATGRIDSSAGYALITARRR